MVLSVLLSVVVGLLGVAVPSALIGAMVGVVLGVGPGWTGTIAALCEVGDVRSDLPWGSLLAVPGIAVLAGMPASVPPGRRVGRTRTTRTRTAGTRAAAALGE